MFQYHGRHTYVESLDLVTLALILLMRFPRTIFRVDTGLLWALLWLLRMWSFSPSLESKENLFVYSVDPLGFRDRTESPVEEPPE